MRDFRPISFVLLLLICCCTAWAQNPLVPGTRSNFRQKTFAASAETIRLDTLSIIPQTFRVKGVDTADYRLDFINALLVWIRKPASDSFSVSYRVFPYRLNPVVQHMRYDSIMNNMSLRPYEFNADLSDGQKGIFNFGSIKAEGSLGRQIAFGNSQDAVLNSTLNLQLSGMLGDSIEINAAITDNNLPVQPDGTTQQLNEFDQVFLQFKKRNWQIDLGDIDIRQNKSYFLNFYKRLQGISVQSHNRIAPGVISHTLASGSIAKGKFTRNLVTALEGNQGPYRLQGANNEFFFIVLANTERVFLDGQLLQRGEDQDYVINYNTAEVTFTPRRMITKDSRIQIEFEYADRNFLNANLYASEELEVGSRLKFRVGFFNNSDARNSSINQVLDVNQKQFLSGIGDSVQQAFYPAAVLDTFAAGKVLYQRVYFVNGAVIDSFYRYSTDPDSARYSLAFTEVGAGRGNYIADFNGANGKVYKYVAPVSGVKQGSYEPVTLLVTPKRQQMLNLGMDYQIDKSTLLKTEFALSNNDVNTFSRKNNGDDKGFAAKMQLNNTRTIGAKKATELTTLVDLEHVQDRFKPLERLRTVEFSRDWGLPLVTQAVTENIVRLGGGIRNKKGNGFNYRFTQYNRSDAYDGSQHALTQSANWGGWLFNNELTLTQYKTGGYRGAFFRPVLDLSKQLKQLANWRLGFRYSLEQNSSRDRGTDTLTANAFSFDTYSVYARSDERKKNKLGLTFFTRADKYRDLSGKNFLRGDRSYNLNLQTELLSSPRRQFVLNATFRKLKVNNAAVSKQKEDETILGRAEYMMNEWKGLLTGNVLYEVGAGQEQKRDFAYLEVPAGTGQYAWIDYNNDGVQQLNEFEVAAFPDQARFLRILTPTNQFIKANYVTLNYSLSLSPRALLSGSSINKFGKLVARFGLVSSFQNNKKTVARGSFEFNPFRYAVTDTALITLSTILANTLSFNRFSTIWGIDLSNINNSGKSLLTYGYESRKLNDWNARFRWNLGQSFALKINGRSASNALYTPNAQFDNRNFELSIRSLEPSLAFIQGTDFRISAGYKRESKKNLPAFGGEQSTTNSLLMESSFTKLQSSSLTGKFTYSQISFRSQTTATTTVSYIMLDGLLPGKNFIWSLIFNKRLMKNLDMNLQYDGRKPAGASTVHTGRASLRALF